MADAGKILIMPKGSYSSTSEYEVLDLVNHKGVSWVAKQNVKGIEPSEANSEFWFKMAGHIVVNNLSTSAEGYVLDARQGKLLQDELEVERARINQLTTLPEGSTTGDAELIDARVGADGKTYANLGEANRTQFTNLKSDLSELSERTRNLIDKSKIVVGNILKGNFESGDKYVTDYIPVKPSTAYTVSGNCSITGNEIAWYDADKNYIERSFTASFITSSNVYYVRLEFNPDVSLSDIEVQLDEGAYASEYIPYMNSADRNFRELVATPSMYGAKGNGLTDDTACFADMLAQSKVVKSDKTKEYKITNVLEIASDTVIRDMVFVDATENGIFYANGKENITIENVKIICTDIAYKSSKKLFNFENCSNVKILNVEIIDTNASRCVWFNACDTVTVERLYINRHYEYGIGCEGDTSNILIRKCRILNNRSAEQYNYSICTYVVYGEEVTTTAKNIVVEDNYIEDFAWTGIDSHGGYNIRVSGNTLVTNTGKGFYGINIGDSRAQCENVLITNNIIEGKKNSKYYAIAFSTLKDIIVSHNVIKSWSYNYDADAQPIIFYGSNATNVCIENNLVDDFRCQLANIGSRDILFKNNRVIFYNTTVGYFNDILFILKGAGALEFIGNSISKFEKMGVLESNGSYNPHPIVKGNTLTPSDVASVGNYVTSTDNVTVEDYKYTEEEVSGILYGLLNDEIITKADADGKYHKYVCTKSFYTQSNPANWAKVY